MRCWRENCITWCFNAKQMRVCKPCGPLRPHFMPVLQLHHHVQRSALYDARAGCRPCDVADLNWVSNCVSRRKAVWHRASAARAGDADGFYTVTQNIKLCAETWSYFLSLSQWEVKTLLWRLFFGLVHFGRLQGETAPMRRFIKRPHV